MLTDIALFVHSPSRSAAFYRALGAARAGDDLLLPSGQIIQLIQSTSPTRPMTTGFDVPDLPAVQTRLAELGVQVETVVPGVISARDPDGNRVTIRHKVCNDVV